MSKKLLRMILIVGTLSILFVFYFTISNQSTGKQNHSLVINEVCSNNFSTAPVRWKEKLDWVELYNASDEAINLNGWTMSDDEETVDKYVLPEIVLEPGRFFVLLASGEGYVEGERIYLNFKLSEGENLYLYDADGKLVDTVAIPTTKENTSYARITDAGMDWVHAIPTPEATNNGLQLVQTVDVQEPEFSLASGFYSGVQQLELASAEGMTIYYTLDGSEPTQDSMMYIDPIVIQNRSFEPNNLSARIDISTEYCYRYAPETLVDKITVVRAIAMDDAGNKSDVVTNSYMVDIQNNACYQGLPTISLSVNPNDFFAYEDGLYVLGSEYVLWMDYPDQWEGDREPSPNYKTRGIPSEKPANITMFDANGKVILEQDIGVRIRGNATRHLSQKSFSLYARELYSGTNKFDIDVFGNGNEYDKMLLVADRDITKIRTQLHGELLQGRDVSLQEFVRCNVFLNGEYWGHYVLGEALTTEFIHNYYGIPVEEIEIAEAVIPEELNQLAANEAGFNEEELYEALTDTIDVDSFIDYYASMIYMDNWDWLPHNGRVWKSKTINVENPYQDGKWRWMVYDTELSETGYDVNTFAVGNMSAWQTDPLAQILVTNEDFCRKFVITFMDLANSVFEKEHVLNVFESILETYEHAIDAQGLRWGDDWADEVYPELDHIREFYEKRFGYITGYLKEEFDLQGELVPILLENSDESKGKIRINTIAPGLEEGSWSGFYYSDYPVTLSVEETVRGSFVGWYNINGDLVSRERTISVELDAENYYRAVFE